MADPRQLSRLSLRKDQVLEFHLDPFPPLPPEGAKIPWVAALYEACRLRDERNQAMMYRLVSNLSIASTPS